MVKHDNQVQTLSVPEEIQTLSVPEAGRKYFGLSRNGSYDAARRGEIPYVQVGRLKRVPVRSMERRLDEAAASNSKNEAA